MKNVSIVNEQNGFTLVDNKGVSLFSSAEWDEVEDYADKNDLNILYGPKDLVFDIDSQCEDGAYIYFDVKYGEGGHDSLGGHNIINLPSSMDDVEIMECTFGYDDESVSEQDMIAELTALGATYQKFL
jgi:ABC-type arginine transport system ATPase subunit